MEQSIRKWNENLCISLAINDPNWCVLKNDTTSSRNMNKHYIRTPRVEHERKVNKNLDIIAYLWHK